MELQAACILIFNLLGNQKLTIGEHDQVNTAFYQVAPKCESEIKKALEKAKK